jgi:hypothetical protein
MVTHADKEQIPAVRKAYALELPLWSRHVYIDFTQYESHACTKHSLAPPSTPHLSHPTYLACPALRRQPAACEAASGPNTEGRGQVNHKVFAPEQGHDGQEGLEVGGQLGAHSGV